MNSTPIHTPARSDAEAGCDRHPVLDQFCDRLARILCGRAADSLLDAGVDDELTSVTVLPSWAWAEPIISVGRKSKARDGGVLRLPVRLSWDTGPVVLVSPGRDETATWSACGLGRTGGASISIGTNDVAGAMPAAELVGLDGPVPSRVRAEVITGARARSQLRHLSEDGSTAYWELLTDIERFVRQEVGIAAGKVAADITGRTDSGFSLDPVTLDAITDRMMFGTGESHKLSDKGRVIAMVERALRPTEFARVEPIRWLRMTIARDAEDEVRRMVGDPHIGRKVRNLARSLGPEAVADLDSFLAAYQERYPADKIAASRAEDALGVHLGPLVAAMHSDFALSPGADPYVDGDMIAVMERVESTRRSRHGDHALLDVDPL